MRILFLFFSLGLNLMVYGQYYTDEAHTRIALKMNTLIVAGIVNPVVEFSVSYHSTLQLEAMGIFQNHGFLWTSRPLSLGATWVEYRYYPRQSLKSWFVGANAGWSGYRMNKGLVFPYLRDYPGGDYQVGQNYMLGLTVGYMLPLNSHFSLELMVGGGHQNSNYEGFHADGSRYVSLNGSGEWVVYKGGLNVVYRF